MGRRLRPEHVALYKRIDAILWNRWVPLGMEAVPGSQDDYYGYLPQVFRMAVDGSGSGAIADYLRRIEQERMGFAGNERKCAEIADFIVHETKALGL
jgi:hypothetical protein